MKSIVIRLRALTILLVSTGSLEDTLSGQGCVEEARLLKSYGLLEAKIHEPIIMSCFYGASITGDLGVFNPRWSLSGRLVQWLLRLVLSSLVVLGINSLL